MLRTRRIAVAGVLLAGFVLGPATSVGAREANAPTRAPRGFHTVKVKLAGFSIAVPDAWRVTTQDPQFRSTGNLQVAFADRASTSLVLVLLLPTNSLPTTSALRNELTGKIANVRISRTKVAGVPALQASGNMKKTAADGTPHTVFETLYLLRGPKGVLDFNFGGRSDGRHDTTVQTMIRSVALLH